jgi:6-phosphogluconolactonase
MIETIRTILKKHQVFSHQNTGITVAKVETLFDGFRLAKDILYTLVDAKTVLYLSGGNTPKTLYEQLATEETIHPGAVGLVDERYGTKFHERSNEKMIQETGLLRYLQMRDIAFYPILVGKSREETAAAYDEKLRSLNATYQKSIAILGIGTDGHTSSLAPNRPDFTNPMFDLSQKHLLVSEFNDQKSAYKERVGMTFLGLEMQDVLLVLVFGHDKKKTLDSVFSEGKETEIPSRFFKRPDIAKKTLFITDQSI